MSKMRSFPVDQRMSWNCAKALLLFDIELHHADMTADLALKIQ